MDGSLFGQMAVDQGFLNGEQLEAALARQRAQPAQTLGQVMVSLGYLSRPQVNGLEKLQVAVASERERKRAREVSEDADESDELALTGRTLGGCLILEQLGVGNMGTAYRAHHLRLDRDVVIKVLHPRMVAVEGYLQRFATEARAAAILEHPAIVSVYDFDSDGDYHFIVMQYVKGQDLRHGLWVAARTLEGLAHAHGHKLIHRDIKPDNLLITPEPRIKIADFGLVRRMTGTTGEDISYLGEIIGTPQYMAPEQASGAGEVDHRCDLYSLGITLFELVCGRPPFQGNSTLEVLEKHILEPLPHMASLAPHEGITGQVQAYVEQLCAKDPNDRFPNCAAALEALNRVRTASRTTTGRMSVKAVNEALADPSRNLDDPAPVVSEAALEELKKRLKQSRSFVAFEGEEPADEGESEQLIAQSFAGLEVQSTELSQARRRLEQARRDPERLVPELMHELLSEGKHDLLLGMLKEFEATLPTSPAVPFFAAEAYERRGDLEEARAKLALATVYAPDHLPARLSLARVLVTLKRPEEAVATLQEACRWHPNSTKAAVRLAEVLYVVIGNAEAAVPAYERAVSLAPSRWKVRLQLAWILHELSRNEAAAAVLEEVIAWKPDAEAAHKLLRRVRRLLGPKVKAAEDESSESGPEGPGPRTSACLQAIRLASASEQPARALEVAESGLKERPNSVPLLLAKAEALIKLNRLSDAVTAYGMAIAADPTNEAANKGLLETQSLRRTQRHKRKS